MLANIRMVLVETSHPGNIGAVARAMKNMGLSELYLVQPKIFPHAEATARAAGADDVLFKARVCETLEEALKDCALVFGTSARLRTIPWPEKDPRECGRIVQEVSRSSPVAVVFGRERVGLTNVELERCNYLVTIPTNPDFSSLNVAAAVQVIAYEIRMAAVEMQKPAMSQSSEELATAEELRLFYEHLQQSLIDTGFLDPKNPKQLMRRLHRLFNRIHLEKTEVNILRGILTAAQTAANKR